MKKIFNLILSIFLLNIFMLGAFADSKYFNYKIKTDDFKMKRINKKYQKRIIEVSNISSESLKLVWSQTYNDVPAQEAYDSSVYYTTIGSQCVAFAGGLTIIGIPFAIHGATEMVKHKNELLLDEINRYVIDGTINWEYIVKPNETIKIHLIEKRLQVNPAYIKLRFTTTDGEIAEEIDCK